MAVLLLFAGARAAAGVGQVEFDHQTAPTVAAVVAQAVQRFPGLGEVVPHCAIAVDGVVDTDAGKVVTNAHSEIALLPPVSGGA